MPKKRCQAPFFDRYSKENKKHLKKLGTSDTITADQARRLALKIKKAIASDSLDDLFRKKSTAPTLREFFNELYLPYVQTYSKSWKHNRSTFKKRCQAPFFAFPFFFSHRSPLMLSKPHFYPFYCIINLWQRLTR